jgi:hypothetical protein
MLRNHIIFIREDNYNHILRSKEHICILESNIEEYFLRLRLISVLLRIYDLRHTFVILRPRLALIEQFRRGLSNEIKDMLLNFRRPTMLDEIIKSEVDCDNFLFE